MDEDIPIVEDIGRNNKLSVNKYRDRNVEQYSRNPYPSDQNNIQDILEERNKLMKHEVRTYSKINHRSNINSSQHPSTDDPNLDTAEEEKKPISHNKTRVVPKPTSMEDEFDGMENEMPAPKTIMIPNAKHRIKLQPIGHMNPV